MNSKDITLTEARFKESIDNFINNVTTPRIDKKVNTTVENERIKTGVIIKFYPYLDKAMVKLDNTSEEMLCKILHRFSGDLIDFYTPLESENTFCEYLKEPCIIPRSPQHVCVLNIADADSEENLILGYYQNEEIVGFDPAKPGNTKIMSVCESNQFWIEFGRDGLDIRLPKEATSKVGDFDSNMENINYVKTGDVYSKSEIDSKLENIAGNDLDIIAVINALTEAFNEE